MDVSFFRGWLWVTTALVFACCGCSLVVDPESLLIRCTVQSGRPDPCADLGMICASGTCQPCEPTLELCDGRDNDCDGNVDEGADSDGDGFTWCGGGHPELVDCVPDNPKIHPTASAGEGQTATPVAEECDGLDNDCDGKIDEDKRCNAMHSCKTDADCSNGLMCDVKTGQCVAPRPGGSVCQTDAQCGDGFCVTTDALGLGDVLADNLCATACCKDADCPKGGVCVQSGSGARVCLPAEIAGRQRAQAGDKCSNSGDCASGVCQRGMCVASCSRDADCGDATCRLNVIASSLLSGAGAWICGAAGGRGEATDLCTMFDPTSCKSALCWTTRCAAPCGSDADCTTGFDCEYVSVNGLLGGGRVTACVDENLSSRDAPGPTCCTNTDCGSGDVCRPMRTGDAWGMFCQVNSVD